MAKKKKLKVVKSVPTVVEETVKFYAHYDATSGAIISMNNFKDSRYPDAVEVTYEQYENLVSGKEEFADYKVGIVIDVLGKPVPGLIYTKANVERSFTRGLVKCITKTDNSDVTVHWDQYNSKWVILMSDALREMFYGNKLPTGGISFYVVMNGDPNMLVRIINVGFQKLCVDKVEVLFESTLEKDIDKIQIIPDLSEIRYSLEIWRVNEQN